MSVKHFYIFRHGQTDLNAAQRYQGQSCNHSLNTSGQKQAQELAESLQNHQLELIVTSPLKRALETAQIIGHKLNVPLIEDAHFIEGNFGSVEGKIYEELTPTEKEIFEDWTRLDHKFLDICFDGGETKRQIMNRAISGLQHLVKRPENVIAISTHSAIVRLVLLYLGRFQHHVPNAKPFHFTYQNGVFCLENEDNLLLLSCCAPCSCAVIQKLATEKRRFSVVFYNPNIRPVAEYEKRRAENERICKLYHIPFFDLEYDHTRWCDLTKGLEHEPERGKRCSICFKMRLKRVMEYANQNGFDAVASVLGVSRYKDLDQVNEMAELAARETRCPYQLIEGRKNGMQEMRAKLIKELELYNQTYCGCKVRP